MEDGYVHEVPTNLKQLARLVARAFYTIEDSLIVDMLVRNPCMKEDDICDLLKFERKMLRGRIATLKADKFLHTRLKMETVDGKSTKVNYYFINYKTFVNIVKYKLDHMRKRLETSERDATSRASFHCPGCKKNFTDFDAHMLCDPTDPSGDFKCTHCGTLVEEDQSSLPKTDSRQLMATFNDQMQPLYLLLREVEDVKLAPSLLDPEPTDISHLQRDTDGRIKTKTTTGEHWTGEATRMGGLLVEEQRVDVTIGDGSATKKVEVRKELPVWMTQSTVTNEATADSCDSIGGGSTMFPEEVDMPGQSTDKGRNQDDILSVLMALETPAAKPPVIQVHSSDDESRGFDQNMLTMRPVVYSDVEEIGSDDEEDPTMTIGDRQYPLHEINGNQALIDQMTPAEKDTYVRLYQEYYVDD